MELEGIHPRVLRELVEELAKPLSIIYQQSWLTREVPDDWRIASVMPIYKKSWNEDPGNYRPVSLTSVPCRIMERFILSALTGLVQDNQGIRPSQHEFMKGRSCSTNLISFYDQLTCQWMRQRLWILSTWALVRPLTLFPTASSWRTWLPMVWMGVLFTE